jgi:hypothetical protein
MRGEVDRDCIRCVVKWIGTVLDAWWSEQGRIKKREKLDRACTTCMRKWMLQSAQIDG